MTTIEKLVKIDAKLQAVDRYHKVLFEVPAGTESIGVQIDFDATKGVIDLGCEGPDDWRGWSGGARKEFTIREDAATPGYVPGPLGAGTWFVILGIHNLLAPEVEVSVKITMPSEVQIPEEPQVTPVVNPNRGSSRDLPAPEGMRWYAGDFHNHTLHSDGKHTIAELARLGVELGLDFLAVTDHNTVSHHQWLPEVSKEQGITLIPGQEVTTHRGHANAFGDIGWIDFRQDQQTWVEEVESRGGILSINHPIDADCAWMAPLAKRPLAVELWHSTWYRDLYGTGVLAWFAAWDRDAVLLGGNDFHTAEAPNRPGTPVTWVAATDNTPEAILEGVRAGRTTITGSVDYDGKVITPRLLDCPILIRKDDETLTAIAAKDLVLVDFDGKRTVVDSDMQDFHAPKAQGPYCLVRQDRMILALSA